MGAKCVRECHALSSVFGLYYPRALPHLNPYSKRHTKRTPNKRKSQARVAARKGYNSMVMISSSLPAKSKEHTTAATCFDHSCCKINDS
jgi:hypothetical protein